MENKPRVSIITPTMYSRRNFIPLLVKNVITQSYPHELLEWVVVGDSDSRTKDIYEKVFSNIKTIQCKYYECGLSEIGSKRNFSCEKATSKIFANMDDDDFYNRTYVEYSVDTLRAKNVNMVGCRDMLIFYPLYDGKMTIVRGSMVHEGTMVSTKKHWKSHKYAKRRTGEGITMCNGSYYNELDINKVMVCFAHENNTYNKDKLLEATEVKISDNIRSAMMNLYGICKV